MASSILLDIFFCGVVFIAAVGIPVWMVIKPPGAERYTPRRPALPHSTQLRPRQQHRRGLQLTH